MKKIAFYLVGAAAMFAACDKDEELFDVTNSGEEAVVEGYHHELTASVANDNPASRAGFDLTDATFHWLAGDEISVTNENGQFTKYTLKTGAGTASATFQTDGQIGTPQGYALHPHSASHSVDGSTLTFNLPATYTYTHTAGEYGAAPMVAAFEANAENLLFKHVGGAFCFQMAGLPAGTTWFKFEANKQITGSFAVTEVDGNQVIALNGGEASAVTINIPAVQTPSDAIFYIPVPTGTYVGFTISVGNAGGETWSYTSAATNTVNRKSLKKMPKVNLSASTAEAVTDAFTNGGICKLGGDVTLDGEAAGFTLASGKSLVLDLNGHTLSQEKGCTGSYQLINNNGNLTITGNGKVSFNDTGAGDSNNGWGSYTISNRGTLVVDGVTVENTRENATGVSYSIDNNSSVGNATLTVKDGSKIVCTKDCAIRQFANGNKNSVTVEGGEIEGVRAVWIQLPGSDTSKSPEVNLTVKGGTLKSNDSNYYVIYSYSAGNNPENVNINISGGDFSGDIMITGYSGNPIANVETLNISGGNFKGNYGIYSWCSNASAAAEKIIITGGTFQDSYNAYYVRNSYIGTEGTADADYELTDNGDGTYTVVAKQ